MGELGDLEALVLGVLRFELAATPEGIADLLGLEAGRVVALLAELERRGLVAPAGD